MKYITVTQLSCKWGVTPRHIQKLCRNGRLSGAVRMGKIWMLPENVQLPKDRRSKSITENEEVFSRSDDKCLSVIGAAYCVPGTEKELIGSLKDNPGEAMLVKAQFAYLHGDIDACAEYSDKLFNSSEDFEIKIGSAFLMGVCAMYNGNTDRWKNTRTLIKKLSCPNESCKIRKEMWLAVYGASIYDMAGYPEWFRRGCFDLLPPGYYPAARVHYIKYIYIRGDAVLKNQTSDNKDFINQLFLLPAICEPLISQTALDKAVVSEIYLRLLCASSYHHAGEDKLATEHIDRALDLGLPDCIYAPFAEQRLNLDSLIDDRLRIKSPEALTKIKALSIRLITGWNTVHNTVLNRKHTTELTSKELEAARLAVFGLTNAEIASRMGISTNSVKTYLKVAMDKTGAKKRVELAGFV